MFTETTISLSNGRPLELSEMFFLVTALRVDVQYEISM